MPPAKRAGTDPAEREFHDPDFRAGLHRLLACCHREASDADEVLATAARITDGDADSWLHEWTSTAGAVWATAVEADEHGRGSRALAHYRRAATYYAAALSRVLHSSEPDRQRDIWRRQRACWERVVDLTSGPAQRLAIPYDGTTLPGFFFPAPDAAAGEVRPLVIINHGGEDATSQAWFDGGAAAGERGYHWMTFDGPGQQAALFEQGLFLRPDWEAVLTPVLDAMLAQPAVDPGRIALIGIGVGGYLAVRALCFEQRVAAAVADPGVVDVSSCWSDLLPDTMRALLEAGDQTAFDREMHLMELFSPGIAATLRLRGEHHGPDNGSRFALYQRVRRYRLADEITRLRTPLLITGTATDDGQPGQSDRLYARLQGEKCLIELASEPGATPDDRRRAGARRDRLIYDWLDERLWFSR
ncbi:MAG TPA: alpha/beta hydrolase [Solirubrobacteraceae bacterium]|jgi:hypothetical protein|nr:alpha/beta hydrolase [Solirubrobacteraceae bacterium]